MATAGKPIECRAAVCWSKGSDLVIETITVDPPKDNEIRMKTISSGICFSDVHGQQGDVPTLGFPIVLGHESAGIIESVGKNVTSVKPGDHVIPTWCYQCGKCPLCIKGKRNVCLLGLTQVAHGTQLDGTSRLTCKGSSLQHFFLVAGFSEYCVLPEDGVCKINSDVDLNKIAMYGCCVITGYGAVKNTAKVEPGSSVVVIGLGAVGLCAVLGARDSGASKIIGVDIIPEKREIAEKFGMTDFINPRDRPDKKTSDLVKELSGGLGVDYVFVCIGNKAVTDDALNSVSPGGDLIIIAIPDLGDKVEVDSLQLIAGKSIKGTWGGDCVISKDIPILIDQYMNGKMPTDLLITKVITLDQINEGFNLLKKGKSIRTVIKF